MWTFIKSRIPNTITTLNLLSGCVAVILSFSSLEQFGSLTGYQLAFIFIGAAAVFDFCDGAAARALKAYSEIGKELDSLSDLVSFGVAPAMLLFNTVNNLGGTQWVAWAAMFISAMGSLRLAKFNVDTTQSTTFRGLPIPANAIFWIGFISWNYSHGYSGDLLTLAAILIIGLMMVSNVRMFSLKFKNFAWRENFRRYMIIVAAIAFVAVNGIEGLMWTIIFYILLSGSNAKTSI